jgi:hypothetical protein
VRKRKWDSYSSGEALFGLDVTRFPELEQTEREVRALAGAAGIVVPPPAQAACSFIDLL